MKKVLKRYNKNVKPYLSLGGKIWVTFIFYFLLVQRFEKLVLSLPEEK